LALRLAEEDPKRIPSKGWAEMIRKVYEVDPLACPRCGRRMKVVAFITEYAVVDRIVDHLKLTFAAAKPPPSQAAFREILLAADPPVDYFS
jgi:hypothetical protein